MYKFSVAHCCRTQDTTTFNPKGHLFNILKFQGTKSTRTDHRIISVKLLLIFKASENIRQSGVFLRY